WIIDTQMPRADLVKDAANELYGLLLASLGIPRARDHHDPMAALLKTLRVGRHHPHAAGEAGVAEHKRDSHRTRFHGARFGRGVLCRRIAASSIRFRSSSTSFGSSRPRL